MEQIRKLLVESIEATNENVIKNDDEYRKLEGEKNKIIKRFKSSLIDEDYQELEKLIDCFDGQNFITAMGFSFVRALYLEKLLKEKI